MSRRWFNAAAVEWAFWESPPDLPPGLAFTLAVVASFTGQDGRGAYPSAAMVAMVTRRSARQVRRDLDVLADKKLIIPGDRRAVRRLRADRRPAVWDLPHDAREYIGRHRKRGDTVSGRTGGHGDTPSAARGDTSDTNGVTPATERGDMVSPEEFLKNSGTGAAPSATADAADTAPENPVSGIGPAPDHVAVYLDQFRRRTGRA